MSREKHAKIPSEDFRSAPLSLPPLNWINIYSMRVGPCPLVRRRVFPSTPLARHKAANYLNIRTYIRPKNKGFGTQPPRPAAQKSFLLSLPNSLSHNILYELGPCPLVRPSKARDRQAGRRVFPSTLLARHNAANYLNIRTYLRPKNKGFGTQPPRPAAQKSFLLSLPNSLSHNILYELGPCPLVRPSKARDRQAGRRVFPSTPLALRYEPADDSPPLKEGQGW